MTNLSEADPPTAGTSAPCLIPPPPRSIPSPPRAIPPPSQDHPALPAAPADEKAKDIMTKLPRRVDALKRDRQYGDRLPVRNTPVAPHRRQYPLYTLGQNMNNRIPSPPPPPPRRGASFQVYADPEPTPVAVAPPPPPPQAARVVVAAEGTGSRPVVPSDVATAHPPSGIPRPRSVSRTIVPSVQQQPPSGGQRRPAEGSLFLAGGQPRAMPAAGSVMPSGEDRPRPPPPAPQQFRIKRRTALDVFQEDSGATTASPTPGMRAQGRALREVGEIP